MGTPLTRRDLLMALAATGIGAAMPACATTKTVPGTERSLLTGKKGRPNILLLMTDQEIQRLPIPPGYSLPNHDRLRAVGTSYTRYYTTTAPCTPARSTIFTGQHVPLHKMFDNINFPYVGNFPSAIPTLGNMLRMAGYYTAYKGKWHLSRDAGSEMEEKKGLSLKDALEPNGFSDYNPAGDFHGNHWTGFMHDPEIAEGAREWLLGRSREIAQEKPWFLMVGFVNPHDVMFSDNNGPGEKIQSSIGPFEILGAPDAEIYKKQWDVSLPPTFHEDLANKPQAQRDYRQLMNLFFGNMPLDREDMYLRNLNYYLNCLRDVDRHLGTVLDALEESGQLDNTIVIYTSDHGELLGAHGLRQKGPMVYNENLCVPLIVKHPDVVGGKTSSALVSAMDLVPTLLSLAGMGQDMRRAELPALKGHDFSGTLQNPDAPGERADRAGGLLMTYDSIHSVDVAFMTHLVAVIEEGVSALELSVPPKLRPNFEHRGFMRGVFDGRYKFARYFAPVHYNRPKTFEELVANNDIELYDTQTDPDEGTNLAFQPEASKELIVAMNYKLEALISSEIGDDTTIDLPDLPKMRPMKFQR